MLQRRGFSIAITTVAVLLVSACQPGPPNEPTIDDAPTPSPTATPTVAPTTSVTPSATPSPSPSPTAWESFPPPDADEPAEIRAIREAWQNHESIFDEYARDSSLKDMTKLIQFASGDEASSVVHSLGHIRDLGLVRSGRVKYSHVEVTLPEKNKNKPRTAVLTACKDSSNVRYIDASSGEIPTGNDALDVIAKLKVTWVMEQQPNMRWTVSSGSSEQGC